MLVNASRMLQQMKAWTRRDPRGSMTGMGEQPLDDLMQCRIVNDEAACQQVENLGILRG
jgi:hypothetical protein